MAWKTSVLVVANVTATSRELLDALTERAKADPVRYELVVPATPFGGGREAAMTMLFDAIDQLQAAGLEAEGTVANPDPIVAVSEVWDPKRFDEIIVSTLPMKLSKWLHAGLPERIGRITGAPVTHVVSQPPRPAAATTPPPPSEGRGVMMGPLSVMAWGGHRSD